MSGAELKKIWRAFLGWSGWRTCGAGLARFWRTVVSWSGWRRLFVLHPALLVVLTVLCAGGLVWLFLQGLEQSIPACGLYVLAFYTLTADCVFCAEALPKLVRGLVRRIKGTAWGGRYLSDALLRTRLSLYLSLGINLFHVGLQGFQWYVFRSWWFVVLAGYYGILSVMRFLLARYVHLHEIGGELEAEWKRSRTCACILLLVNLSLSAAVLMILFQNRGYAYEGILIYGIALYTFYSVIHAVVDLVRYRRMGSPVLSTAKMVSFSAALVSLLNLETAMLSQFGTGMPDESKRLMIILTGAGVSVIVVTMSVILIVRANRELRRESHVGEA